MATAQPCGRLGQKWRQTTRPFAIQAKSWMPQDCFITDSAKLAECGPGRNSKWIERVPYGEEQAYKFDGSGWECANKHGGLLCRG